MASSGTSDREPDAFAAMVRAWTPDPNLGSADYLAAITEGQWYISGTSVPAIGEEWLILPSGIHVPRSAANAPGPLDLVTVYVTWEEVAGGRATMADVVEGLSGFRRDDVLAVCAHVLTTARRGGEELAALERRIVSRMPDWSPRRNLEVELGQGRRFLTPQGCSVLAKIALAYCDNSGMPLGPENVVVVGTLLLFVNDLMTAEEAAQDDETEQSNVFMWVAANQWFNRTLYVDSTLSLFESRWMSPTCEPDIDFVARYEAATGIAWSAVEVSAIAMWAAKHAGKGLFLATYFDQLATRFPDAPAACDRYSLPIAEFIEQVKPSLDTPRDMSWDFDLFDRYPLITLETGERLLFDESRLLRRCFGWGSIYDINESLPRKQREQFLGVVAKQSEAFALQSLEETYSGGPAKRLYTEADLKAAYDADGVKTADAAVDFGHRWIVFEICARRPLRSGLNAAAESDYAAMLEQVLQEAEQVYSTISQIAAEPARLVSDSHASTRPTRFYPIVVMTEGFPATTVTHANLRDQIRNKGWATGLNCAELEVIDSEDLRMIADFAVVGASLPDLIDHKATTNFLFDSLRNYALTIGTKRWPMVRRRPSSWQSLLDRVQSATR